MAEIARLTDPQVIRPRKATGSSQPRYPDRPSLAGQVFEGKFRLLSLIGRGGMGDVYKAEHISLSRTVAVKVLRPRGDTAEDELNFVRRFQREAIMLAKIQHPNAVAIHDFGISKGMPYIVMEYVEGISLRQAITQDVETSFHRNLKIMEQVCLAVHEAHSQGIIHRDLKPDNVLLSKLGDGSIRSVVLDFGIAKIQNPELDAENTETPNGLVFGTPHYMSPEQLRNEHLDARSDVYSIGVMLYELIAGVRPFVADSTLQLAMMHLSQRPPEFSATAPDRWIPESLRKLVMSTLEKKREHRPANAETVAKALRAITTHGSVEMNSVRPAVVSSTRPRPKLVVKRTKSSAVFMAMFVIASSGLIAALMARPKLQMPISLPVPQLAEAAENLANRPAQPVDYLEVIEKAKALKEKGNLAEAETLLRRAMTLDLGSNEPHKLLADIYIDSGDLKNAQQELEAAVKIDSRDGRAFLSLGYVSGSLGDTEKSLEALKVAAARFPRELEIQFALGNAYERVGRYDDAITAYRESLRINAKDLRSYYKLAKCYQRLLRWDHAALVYGLILNIDRDNPFCLRHLKEALEHLGPEGSARVKGALLAVQEKGEEGHREAIDAARQGGETGAQ